MRILLFEDYSGLHTFLAKGLRELGHEVVTVGNGNMFHNLPRDIDIRRRDCGRLTGLRHWVHMVRLLPRFRGFDIVQLINPDAFGLKPQREYFFYHFLKRHNRRLLVGAFGADWHWTDDGLHHKTFRYGDFYIGNRMRTDEAAQQFVREYDGTEKGRYCKYVMEDCDAIPACLYEYKAVYAHYLPEKTTFIPLPMLVEHDRPVHTFGGLPLRVFIGIDKKRSEYKGTDIMWRALCHVAERHPQEIEVVKAESLPFDEYSKAMNGCDVMLDQLYAYTPSMNSLLAMQKGIIVVGGGEPEGYDLLGERELRPIVNVEPTFESVVDALEQLIAHPERIAPLKQQSIDYVKKHHDYRKVAVAYEALYKTVLGSRRQFRP